jgi:hypothetical protein
VHVTYRRHLEPLLVARDLLAGILVMMIGQNGLRVLQARYLRRDSNGRITETPKQLFERVARAVSESELLHGSAAGIPLGQLSAVEDSMESRDGVPVRLEMLELGLGKTSDEGAHYAKSDPKACRL